MEPRILSYLSYLSASIEELDYAPGIAYAYLEKNNIFSHRKINFFYSIEEIFLWSEGQQAVEQGFKNDLAKINALLASHQEYQLYIGLGVLAGTLGENQFPAAVNAPLLYFPVKTHIAKYAVAVEQDLSKIEINMPLLCEIFNTSEKSHDKKASKNIFEAVAWLENKLDRHIRNQKHFNEETFKTLLPFLDYFFLKLDNALKTNEKTAIELTSNKKDWQNFDNSTQATLRHICGARQDLAIFCAPKAAMKNQATSLKYLLQAENKMALLPQSNAGQSAYSASVLEHMLKLAFEERQLAEITSTNNQEDFLISKEEIKKALSHIPLFTTPNQHEAIERVFNQRISILEAPPGGEKIQTLSAILLSSYLLGKKTLIYSNNFDADIVDMLKQHVKEFFSNPQFSPVLLLEKGDNTKFKRNLEKTIDFWLSQNDLINEELSDLSAYQSKIEKDIERLQIELSKHYEALGFYSFLNLDYRYKNEAIAHKQKEFNLLAGTQSFQGPLIHFEKTNSNFLGFLEKVQKEYDNNSKRISRFHKKQLASYSELFNQKFSTHVMFEALLPFDLPRLISHWLSLHTEHTKIKNGFALIEQEENKAFAAHHEIPKIKEKLALAQKEFLSTKERKKVLSLLRDQDNKQMLSNFKSCITSFEAEEKIQAKLQALDFETILEFFPLCVASSADIQEFVKTEEAIYDNVIIEGAQFLNIAEIAPLLYRSKKVCFLIDEHLPLPQNPYTNCLQEQEESLWEKNMAPFMDYEAAKRHHLNYHKSYILNILEHSALRDLVKNEKFLLTEQREILPALFDFNNENFYDNKLEIVNRTPARQLASTFDLIKIEQLGTIAQLRTETATRVFEVIKDIVGKNYKPYSLSEEFTVKSAPSIGVVVFCVKTAKIINGLIQAKLSPLAINQHKIVCVAAEEPIAFERDVVIVNAYETPEAFVSEAEFMRLFNSATTKALLHNIFIYDGKTKNKLIQKYIQYIKDYQSTVENNLWEFFTSENDLPYKQLLTQELKIWIQEVNSRNPHKKIQIYNQFKPQSHINFDFIVYNPNTAKFVGIEIEGADLFQEEKNLSTYQKHYRQRLESLEKDNWKILSTPYYKSANYFGQSVSDLLLSPAIDREVVRIKKELNNLIF